MDKRKRSMSFLSPEALLLGNGIKEIWQNFSQSGKYCQNHSSLRDR
jgi:hypothetical protein